MTRFARSFHPTSSYRHFYMFSSNMFCCSHSSSFSLYNKQMEIKISIPKEFIWFWGYMKKKKWDKVKKISIVKNSTSLISCWKISKWVQFKSFSWSSNTASYPRALFSDLYPRVFFPGTFARALTRQLGRPEWSGPAHFFKNANTQKWLRRYLSAFSRGVGLSVNPNAADTFSP